MDSKKVLIIEDNLDIQEVFRYAFEDAGYEVKTSDNGLLGITEIVDYRPTVVVLDIMMPEMSGYDFLSALKNNTSIKVPVVVVSNLAQDQDKKRSLEAGADLFLVKSDFDGPELVARIEEFLYQRAHPTSTIEIEAGSTI